MKDIKTFYRIKLLENSTKTLWASIDCVNSITKYIVSTADLYNETCYDDYRQAVQDYELVG